MLQFLNADLVIAVSCNESVLLFWKTAIFLRSVMHRSLWHVTHTHTLLSRTLSWWVKSSHKRGLLIFSEVHWLSVICKLWCNWINLLSIKERLAQSYTVGTHWLLIVFTWRHTLRGTTPWRAKQCYLPTGHKLSDYPKCWIVPTRRPACAMKTRTEEFVDLCH